MFIIWKNGTNREDNFILFAKNTLDELKETFFEYCKKKNISINNDDLTKNEQILKGIDLYELDDNYYYCNIENIDANKEIYMFSYNECGDDSSYFEVMCFSFSNNKEELFNVAEQIFCEKSMETTQEDIKLMINAIKENSYYEIPNPIENEFSEENEICLDIQKFRSIIV